MYMYIYIYVYIWAISHGHIYFLHAVNVTQYKYDASTSSDKLDLPNRQIEAKKFKKIGISMETFRVLKKKQDFWLKNWVHPVFPFQWELFPGFLRSFWSSNLTHPCPGRIIPQQATHQRMGAADGPHCGHCERFFCFVKPGIFTMANIFKGCRPCRRPRKNRQGSQANWHKNSSVLRTLRLSTFFLCILLWKYIW